LAVPFGRFVRIAAVRRALLLFFIVACGQRPGAKADAGSFAMTPSPAEIRKGGNHLVGQSSLYLREHAHQPIDWYPWGPEALERARRLDRPILLSIGYASCHWCHVMVAEVFDSDDVAAIVNESFVAIKVDREEMPDVDATYLEAVQAMNGSGGWPATLLLTPSLKPFFGGTYLPKARFLEVLRGALKELASNRAGVEDRGKEIAARLARGPEAPGERVRPGEIRALAERGLASVDEAGGGFKARMKFPSASRWIFLLHAARKWGAPFARPVRRTLDAMASGALFDHVGGGFFRYTTDASWTVPHFEKMLYVNAQLARLYLEAHGAFGEARDLTVARRTLDFLMAEMQSPDGAFYASFDADSGGKEGAYYVFTTAELRALFGSEAASVEKALGATERGHLDGANVITFRGADAERLDPKRWEAIRKTLLAARASRIRPARDEKIVTAWNGLAIDAFARGFAMTGDQRYRDAAVRAADHVWRVHAADPKKLARTSNGGTIAGDGMLEDYAALAFGLVTLTEATGETRFLERALALEDAAIQGFVRPSGGFFTTPAGGPLERRVELFDNEEPCGIPFAIETELRLAGLTGKPALYERIDRALAADAGSARSAGLAMGSWLDAALLESGPFYDVVIAGAPAKTGALASVWRSIAPPWAVRLDVGDDGPNDALRVLAPAAEGKVARGGAATAYVCVRGACQKPATDPATLRTQLLDGWTR
jgi:uncharacterized protein